MPVVVQSLEADAQAPPDFHKKPSSQNFGRVKTIVSSEYVGIRLSL